MDFIEALPNTEGKRVIWVIVDRMTKYSHFIAPKHPYTTESPTEIYLNHITSFMAFQILLYVIGMLYFKVHFGSHYLSWPKFNYRCALLTILKLTARVSG